VNQLHWGIVGLGSIVNGTMAPAMVADPDSEIVAAVSRDQGRADAFAEKFGARFAYTDYDEMVANPEVTAVFVATPNSQHAEQVLKAAAAGKHVFCDKPMSLNAADALREIQGCRAAGVMLGINFHNRQLQWVRDCKQLIADGTIGEVLTVHVEASAGLRPPQDWRNNRQLAGLGTTYSQGVHVFDFLRWMLDSDPVEVVAFFDDEGQWEVETETMALLSFGNGAKAYTNINQRNPYPKNDIVIYGTKGRIEGLGLTRSRFDGELSVVTESGRTSTTYPQPSGEAHRRNLAAFTSAVLASEEPNASGVDGLHSMLLTDAITRSVAEKRVVKIDYTALNALD
jgi:1,5-anhydro-D-fructose reductase (1,5-anhydro-D-mannitol-forming)